jgi:2-polyprenyl-6-methoxyphenol hydroxylase-like FAD-dependent oxidoreductase
MPDRKILQTPIAIVGGGPVGLMLALFLDRHGVRSVVFNSEPGARHHPKGSTHNARTMEHYRRLGLGAQIRKLGLPPDHPTDVVYLTRFNGPELARLPMPSEQEKMRMVTAAPRSDQVPEPIHRANQMYVERFLLQHAATRRNITLRFGRQVDAFAQDADGVTLHAEAVDGSGEESWRAQYLVGCDGGRSFVRRTLGIQYEGFAALEQEFFGAHMVSTYLRAPTLYRDYLGSRRAWQYWVVNPELRTGVVALNGSDEFIVWSRGVPHQSPDNAAIAALVRRATGAEIPLEIIAHGAWTGGIALTADRFADRRVLLAGDAVHLFTPTGGFGMNTGIDDAANLAWKLAAMLQGWGGSGLLASYEAERKPIAVRNTTASRALAKNVGEVPVPAELEQNSPAGGAARAKTGDFLSGFGEEFASIGVQLGARYDGSPIVAADGDPPPDNFVQYTPTSVPGGRAPHYWLDDARVFGSSLFDRLGVGFTLLRLGPKPPDADALLAAASARKVPLSVLQIPDAEARELYARDLVLIRPDQHVGWRGNAPPDDPEPLWGRLTGASSDAA